MMLNISIGLYNPCESNVKIQIMEKRYELFYDWFAEFYFS